MNALKVENLTKQYNTFKLDNISFTLPKGYIMGYIGQNGAGKTTTINLIMDFINKDNGDIEIFGKQIQDDEKEYKKQIGYICDECYFIDTMTCTDISKILSDFYDTFSTEKFNNFLSKWNIQLDKTIKSLSKGMKMKLMLAGILSRDTKILIMDEPTSGLDPIFRNELLGILQEYISDEEHSVLFSTHIISDVEKISDYICYINNGRIVLNDTTESLLQSHIILKGPSTLLDAVEDKLISYNLNRYGFEGIAKTEDTKGINDEIVQDTPSIEDIMLYYNKMEAE